jgi:hypothetical protein
MTLSKIAECCYAQYHLIQVSIMLSDTEKLIMLSVVMLSVVMLCVDASSLNSMHDNSWKSSNHK